MKPFTTLALAVFVVVAGLDFLRILMGWEVVIGGVMIPMWASYLGLLLAGGLAVMLRRESGQGKN